MLLKKIWVLVFRFMYLVLVDVMDKSYISHILRRSLKLLFEITWQRQSLDILWTSQNILTLTNALIKNRMSNFLKKNDQISYSEVF